MRDSRGKRIVVLFLDRLARRKREGPHGASMEGPKKGDVQVSPRASVNGSNLLLTPFSKDVGKFFGIVKNSTISSVDRRLKREMIRDKKIKRNIEALKLGLSKGQE